MFTGIIEEVGTISSIRSGSQSVSMVVEAQRVLEETRIGDSINTDGVCLTVAALQSSGFMVDVMPETMTRTTFNKLNPGSKVNLERALRLSDRLGGHIVSGHIDGIGRIMERRKEGNTEWFRISADSLILNYIVTKGSVAIDGISLTVINVDKRSLTIGIIPHTQTETTILHKRVEAEVNIECDILGKYVEKLIQGENRDGVTLESLAKNGFI
ncbi:MAG: riboflavin synthase [Bacteroidales bacterium]|nr:riboflavin synthase [Bacteroidota bacterium]MBL6950126.1 riboflavin synthase [Bacteroidales bacterium]